MMTLRETEASDLHGARHARSSSACSRTSVRCSTRSTAPGRRSKPVRRPPRGRSSRKSTSRVRSELRRLHRNTRADHRLRAPQVAARVDGDGGIDEPVGEIERDEAALLQAPADDELVAFPVVAGVLDVRVVLVGPEPVHLGVRLARAEHRARRGRPCSMALRQCSTRIRRPKSGCRWLATSPAA